MQLATPVTQEALPELLRRIQKKTPILWNDNHDAPTDVLLLEHIKDIALLLFVPPAIKVSPPMGLDWCPLADEQWLKDRGCEFVDNETFFNRICSERFAI